MNGRAKILGVGSAIVDYLVRADESFLVNAQDKGNTVWISSSELDSLLVKAAATGCLERVPGGSAANTLFGLQELGMATALLGKTGRDADGEFFRSAYLEAGGDAASLKYSDSLSTGRCLSVITPDCERTMYTCLAAGGELLPDDISENDFSDVTHVLFEGYMLCSVPYFNRAVELAEKADCVICLDLSSFEIVRRFRDELKKILYEHVDVVFANFDEAREFSGESNFAPMNALAAFARFCDTSAVKLGKAGSIIRSGSFEAVVDAETAEVLDTTGAGDLWQAGFLYGYIKGLPPEICGRFASVTAAEVIKVTGAKIPSERWDYIRRRFSEIESRNGIIR